MLRVRVCLGKICNVWKFVPKKPLARKWHVNCWGHLKGPLDSLLALLPWGSGFLILWLWAGHDGGVAAQLLVPHQPRLIKAVELPPPRAAPETWMAKGMHELPDLVYILFLFYFYCFLHLYSFKNGSLTTKHTCLNSLTMHKEFNRSTNKMMIF